MFKKHTNLWALWKLSVSLLWALDRSHLAFENFRVVLMSLNFLQ
ncbi:hypothetical protein [Leptospira noguchii]|nr:hypothetical protein [Leptospira noguchii]